jgi:hypothetical protein
MTAICQKLAGLPNTTCLANRRLIQDESFPGWRRQGALLAEMRNNWHPEVDLAAGLKSKAC